VGVVTLDYGAQPFQLIIRQGNRYVSAEIAAQ
jgi:hypothetical protein